MDAHKVLSFSPDREALLKREAALRKSGVEVFSTSTENQARFEIETGKCGVLLICFRVSPLQAKDLASLFRKNGYIIFVLNDTTWEARQCKCRLHLQSVRHRTAATAPCLPDYVPLPMDIGTVEA